MLFLGLQVLNLKCVLFSGYESYFDSSICYAKDKIVGGGLFMAHSLAILVTVLDATVYEISVPSKGLAACLLALFLIRPTFASYFPITLHQGNWMGKTSI